MERIEGAVIRLGVIVLVLLGLKWVAATSTLEQIESIHSYLSTMAR